MNESNLKTALFASVVTSLLLIGAFAFINFADTTVTPTPIENSDGGKKFGALAGPDIPYPYISVGNQYTFYNGSPLQVGTTTSCAIQSPPATSTLDHFAVNVMGGNQVNQTVSLTKGVGQQSSTTALSSQYALAAGAQGAFVASTTNPETTRIIAPNNWVQANFFGGSGVSSTTGSCSAVFRVI